MLYVSFRQEEQSHMKNVNTTNITDEWARFNAMTEEQRHEAAMSDPDAIPMTEEELDNAPIMPRVKTLRRALELTQEEFALRYHIPLGTLRDWEQGRVEPDQSTRTYLTLIAREPETVDRILNTPIRTNLRKG